MTTTDERANPSEEKADFRMYHELQYERIGQLEQQRLTMTNVVISISAAVFAVEFGNVIQLHFGGKLLLSIALIAINLFALLYAWKSRRFVKMHQKRAKQAREKYAPYLNQLNDAVPKIDSDSDSLNRTRLQQYVHVIMILIAVVSVFI